MSELTTLLENLVADLDAGRPVGLCAVVRTRGSTPQAAGAAMLVRSDMSTAGTLGGGCVEAEVRRRAFEHLQQSRSELMDFVLNHDYGWDDGLICGGRMIIGMQSIAPADAAPFRAALDEARHNRPARLPLRVRHEGVTQEYLVRLEVPPTLWIAGAGHIGQAVARLAVDLDFAVHVVDDRADFVAPERFDPRVTLTAGDIAETLRDLPDDPYRYILIVTRGHQNDHRALEAVIRRPAAYIGMIGSRRKSRLILDDLAAAGVPVEQCARVRTPIGLPIGAVTVNEIAVSVAAELIAERRSESASLIEGPRVVSPEEA